MKRDTTMATMATSGKNTAKLQPSKPATSRGLPSGSLFFCKFVFLQIWNCMSRFDQRLVETNGCLVTFARVFKSAIGQLN